MWISLPDCPLECSLLRKCDRLSSRQNLQFQQKKLVITRVRQAYALKAADNSFKSQIGSISVPFRQYYPSTDSIAFRRYMALRCSESYLYPKSAGVEVSASQMRLNLPKEKPAEPKF
jgi:hypothetical protein